MDSKDQYTYGWVIKFTDKKVKKKARVITSSKFSNIHTPVLVPRQFSIHPTSPSRKTPLLRAPAYLRSSIPYSIPYTSSSCVSSRSPNDPERNWRIKSLRIWMSWCEIWVSEGEPKENVAKRINKPAATDLKPCVVSEILFSSSGTSSCLSEERILDLILFGRMVAAALVHHKQRSTHADLCYILSVNAIFMIFGQKLTSSMGTQYFKINSNASTAVAFSSSAFTLEYFDGVRKGHKSVPRT